MTEDTGQVAGEGREWTKEPSVNLNPIGGVVPNLVDLMEGAYSIAMYVPEPIADQMIADHNRASLLTEALAALKKADLYFCDRHGYCPECGDYAGHDRVQGGRGDASNHEPDCSRREAAIAISALIAKLSQEGEP